MEVSKKQLRLLLPELKNKKFCALYMKREKTLYLDIYTETNDTITYGRKTIKAYHKETIIYQGELQSIMRELKLKQLGI